MTNGHDLVTALDLAPSIPGHMSLTIEGLSGMPSILHNSRLVAVS